MTKILKKISVVIAFVLLGSAAFYLYVLSGQGADSVSKALTVKIASKNTPTNVALYVNDKLIVHKTEGENFYFPESLVGVPSTAVLVALEENGEAAYSGEFSLKNYDKLTIKDIKDGELILDIRTEQTSKEFTLPPLDTWKVSLTDKHVVGEYKADTDLYYTLYVLGRGGNLGLSDTLNKGETVTASWERPREKKDSWLVFTNTDNK